MKIYVSKQEWDGFIKRSKRKYPNEYIEGIWGTETIEGFRIAKFVAIKHKGKPASIDIDDFELKKQSWKAKQEGLTYLGSVHTHPSIDYDSCPSSVDHQEGFRLGDRLMGILVIYKEKNRFKTVVEWWFPQPTLKFVILED